MFQFDNFAEFARMAGHGAFVWSAYAIALVVMAGLVACPLGRHRRLLKAIAQRDRDKGATGT